MVFYHRICEKEPKGPFHRLVFFFADKTGGLQKMGLERMGEGREKWDKVGYNTVTYHE